MLGIRTTKKSRSNNLQIRIPDVLKNVELEIIIFPLNKNKQTSEEYEFWSEDELSQIGKMDLSTPLKDKEDYRKW